MSTIPNWMQQSENYIPEKDSDGFITRSLLSVMSAPSLLKGRSSTDTSIHSQPVFEISDCRNRRIGVESSADTPDRSDSKPGAPGADTEITRSESGSAEEILSRLHRIRPSASVKLLLALLIILLASCSKNMFFTYTMLAVLLVHMCTLGSCELKRVFTVSLAAAAFSALLLVPAVFLGNPHTLLTVSLKVFLSVGLLAFMGATTPWNRITEGLRQFHIPDLFIFTFDITLKYIVIIGDICADMLNGLKLRSVGKNRTKKKSFSGILGVTFLKSRRMSEEMCGAMACRGFEGEYSKGSRQLLAKADLLFILFAVLIVLYYIYLE